MNRPLKLFATLSLVALAFLVTAVGALANAARVATLRPVNGHLVGRGTAEYRSRAGQRELEVVVNHLSSLAGKRVSVYVAGSKIGATRVSNSGTVEFGRNAETSRHIPQVQVGTPVAVATDRAVILTGSFR